MPSSKSSDSSKNIVIAGLVAATIWAYYQCPTDSPPDESPTSFSQEIRKSVLPIRNKLSSSPEKSQVLGEFYLAWVDALERDRGNRIKTTALFRTAHSASLDVFLQETGMQGEPTVGEEIDAAIIAAIGNRVVPIDEDLSQQLQKVLLAIAWACNAKISQ
tara:strand:+ start:105 stop:584 length:480 start_codon:yes stop_codon:yes gene_type:complete